MEKLIESLKSKYAKAIDSVTIAGKAEINITIKNGVNADTFSQELQDHLIEVVDPLSIFQFNILDHNGEQRDSFATNQ
jgi:hypothetical protein